MKLAPRNDALPDYGIVVQEHGVSVPALYQLATGTPPSARLRGYGFRERIAGRGGVPIVFEWPVGEGADLDRFLAALDEKREVRRAACHRCGA